MIQSQIALVAPYSSFLDTEVKCSVCSEIAFVILPCDSPILKQMLFDRVVIHTYFESDTEAMITISISNRTLFTLSFKIVHFHGCE